MSGMVRPNRRAGLSCRLKPSAMRVVCERCVRNGPAERKNWIIVAAQAIRDEHGLTRVLSGLVRPEKGDG